MTEPADDPSMLDELNHSPPEQFKDEQVVPHQGQGQGQILDLYQQFFGKLL